MHQNQWTDDEIVQAVKSADISREKALYHLYFTKDWKGLAENYVMKNGGNKEDGEDLAQTAMTLFDRNVREGKYRGDSSMKTYFLSIVKFQWYKTLRSIRPTDELKVEHFEETGGDVEDTLIRSELKEYLEKALGNIGERCKKILLLQRLEYSHEEIAAETGINGAAMAKKEAYRCRMRFRQFLEENPGWKDIIN